jgi:hypothetical protein
LTIFWFEIILWWKTTFEFSKFKIQILYTTSDGETTKMKVIDLEKLWNFVADNFFIWIRLGSQILISKSGEHKTAKTKISFDTNSLQVEWLGAEDSKQEVKGSSASGC